MKKIIFVFLILLPVCFCFAQTVPDRILGNGSLSKDFLVNFLSENNPGLNKDRASAIVDLYISEANIEDVNYEIAFAQMCYHTNFLRFNGTFVKADSNNFFGSTSFNNINIPYSFDSLQEGIRAHIQHLKGYAARERLKNVCVDPRYYRIEEEYGWGSSPALNDLSNKWGGRDYADKINNILVKMHAKVAD